MPSLVTESVGKEDMLEDVECKGPGIIVMWVGTTEKSTSVGPVECKGKKSTFIKDGHNSAVTSFDSSMLL